MASATVSATSRVLSIGFRMLYHRNKVWRRDRRIRSANPSGTENAAAAELGSSPVGYCNGFLARRTGPRCTMDVIVTPAEGGTVWQLTDLLGRLMGRITASAPRQFMIHPEGHASETMAGIQQGPHASLDAALAEIERHTRGVCRRNPGKDQL
jgi:hypothetical protein